jgi:hypothetical protein
MDELEWLREHSPSTQPSRDVTHRHRMELRAAIAAEGVDGTRPRRPRRERRSRHRVLVTTAAVVAVCAAGAGLIALTSSGDESGNTVGAPAADEATTAAPAQACTGAPPKQLAIPAGFGSAVAAPAKQATTAPASTQQVTSWSSDQVTIEQRWPADADAIAKLGTSDPSVNGFNSFADANVIVDARGAAHRTVLFRFGGQSKECAALQVTVYGGDPGTVKALSDDVIREPFLSSEPLVTTTSAAASAPDVAACPGPAGPAAGQSEIQFVATIGTSARGGFFPQPDAALIDFLATHKTLFAHGYRALQLADSSIVYAKDVQSNVVTTVHVVPTKAGWTVDNWQASGC